MIRLNTTSKEDIIAAIKESTKEQRKAFMTELEKFDDFEGRSGSSTRNIGDPKQLKQTTRTMSRSVDPSTALYGY